jgi:heat shock protein HtpX
MQSPVNYASGTFHNMFQTAVILAAMVSLFSLLGWMIFGGFGIFWALMIVGFILAGTPRLSPLIVLRVSGARPLTRADAAGLHRIAQELSSRAGLEKPPSLFYFPSRSTNAFSVGSQGSSAIALSHGLIQLLNLRELTGVLAHEISHIRSNDLRLHALADMMTRVTSLLSFFGQVLVIFYLPVIVFTDAHVPLLFILTLLAAPAVSVLLQLGLSRTREFRADLFAVRLTGDPKGLASALQKMESYERGLWDILAGRERRDSHPSILRTHPHTSRRVERIMQLEREQRPDLTEAPRRIILQDCFPEIPRPPRRTRLGPWR